MVAMLVRLLHVPCTFVREWHGGWHAWGHGMAYYSMVVGGDRRPAPVVAARQLLAWPVGFFLVASAGIISYVNVGSRTFLGRHTTQLYNVYYM